MKFQTTTFPITECIHTCLKGKTLEPYLQDLTDEELNRYLLSEKVLSKYWRIFDVRQRSDTSSCCFTKAYTHYAEGTGSILQHNSQEPFHKRFDEFKNEENIEILKPLKLRYFTPREVANLMGFPDQHFDFPENTSLKTKYRLLGNSLNVIVVSSLLKLLLH